MQKLGSSSQRKSKPFPGWSSESYQALSDDSKDMAAFTTRLDHLEEKERELAALIGDISKAFTLQLAPLEDQRQGIVQEKERLNQMMATMLMSQSVYPPAPGPKELQFVDGGWFNVVCNFVVVLNLASMAFASSLQAYHTLLYVFDQLFLIWYVLELVAKWKYHRCNLFFGNIRVVWWNWLDAAIVLGGVVDQWIMALLQDFIPFKIPAISLWLRYLRIFRVMRFLKVVKAFAHGDMSWTEEAPFQLFMSGVIGVNSIVLWLELDIDWSGWACVEQTFLVIYTFELAVRLKEFGLKFFVNRDLIWNNLDFAMVCGGIFDLWLMPAWYMIQRVLHGHAGKHNATVTNFLKILKMTKILRVLRLVRLLRMVKPLYTLLIGVMHALDAMKWVMILTLFLLYGGAIVFTSLIGHGYIYSSRADVPPEAQPLFGSVPQSIFSLFKLMNGDTSVVTPITKDIKGRLLFMSFMVLSNWAVLAILTSVVSEHMISSSQRIDEEDKKREEEEQLASRTRRLNHFFSKIDTNKDGNISRSEWKAMMTDPDQFEELRSLTNLERGTLHEVFAMLSEEVTELERRALVSRCSIDSVELEEHLRCDDFVSHINHDKEAADRRQVLHLRYWLEKITVNRLKRLESHLEDKFEDLGIMLGKVLSSPSSENSQKEIDAYVVRQRNQRRDTLKSSGGVEKYIGIQRPRPRLQL